MTRFGDLWIDNIMPGALALLIGLAYVLDGGGLWALVITPVAGWILWQLARWAERTWRQ